MTTSDDLVVRFGRWALAKVWFGVVLSGGYALGRHFHWPQAFLVTAIADERKGEKLAVVTTVDLARVPALLEQLASSGLPNLFIPRADAFVKVDALPLLGTGKLDLQGARRLARERLGA